MFYLKPKIIFYLTIWCYLIIKKALTKSHKKVNNYKKFKRLINLKDLVLKFKRVFKENNMLKKSEHLLGFNYTIIAFFRADFFIRYIR